MSGRSGDKSSRSGKPAWSAGDRVAFPSGETGLVVRVHRDHYEVLLDSPKGALATVPFELLPPVSYSELDLWKMAAGFEPPKPHERKPKPRRKPKPLDPDERKGVAIALICFVLFVLFGLLR